VKRETGEIPVLPPQLYPVSTGLKPFDATGKTHPCSQESGKVSVPASAMTPTGSQETGLPDLKLRVAAGNFGLDGMSISLTFSLAPILRHPT